ncbi:EAL domain-containing protein [Hirschia baltica]|uniref:Diguanylate phosphodiesterase n=1 Tax=Hirschia baltica (strain ATCC 49814 / DSM 5838 / IFAM 1418) TaxID=582402 RepID=C6XR95_HIRBI|nr:EAL domain-containing protein [Hirschia baltica]ACT58727.1 diguanylate phosphodiesterase [Hirschia baltica ATCC 49814]
MASLDESTAISAARAAVWHWSKLDARFTIEADPSSPLEYMSGEWTLNEFLAQLDGLARSGIEKILVGNTPDFAIDQKVILRNGDSARIIGSAIDDGTARGLLYVRSSAGKVTVTNLDGLEPVYQPIWDAKTRELAGFEALARWRTPLGELIGPEGLYEYGLVADWTHVAPTMLDKAAKALARFRRSAGDVFMQVNLSAAEIARATLVQEVESIIRACDLPRDVLRIELTEQAALRDVNRALGAFAAFRAAGAGIVLDDFGAGHSSLAWLADIPADGLKLDQRLTSMMSRPRGRVIIKAIIDLAHDLDMSVTAEGVETHALADHMRDVGCDFLQGYVSGEPVCEDAILEFLRSKIAPFSMQHVGEY